MGFVSVIIVSALFAIGLPLESEHFVAPATSEQVGGDQLMMLAQPSGSIEVSGSLIDL